MRISNIKYPISNAKWGSKFTSYVLSAISSQLSANSQAGVAQLALVMLLLAGVAVGTYVVQNRTNISPNAQGISRGQCDGKYEFIGNEEDPSGESDNAGEDAQWRETDKCKNDSSGEKASSCGYDQKSVEYSCKNGYRCFEDFFQDSSTSCKWQYKDPHYHCDEDSKCSTESKNSADKNEEECKKSGNIWEDNTCKTKSVSKSPSQPGTAGDKDTSDSTSYDQGDCRDGAQVFKDGYTWITYCTKVCSKNSDCPQNKTDGAVNPETSNWCYGFNGGKAPRCMMLVQSDNKEVTDTNRKTNNTKAVEDIKSTIAKGGDPSSASTEAKMSSSVELRAKVDAQNKQRSDLLGELATVLNKGDSGNSNITAAVNRAQSLLNTAASSAVNCYTGHDKPLSDSCDATAQAANDIAVAASRVALFDAVSTGVPDTCVKVDMAVGEKTSNSLIEVSPSNNTNFQSRLFMCRGAESSKGAKDGDIKWQVRDANGSWQSVSQDSLDKLNLKNGQKTVSAIPADFIARRNNAATLASLPAYSATSQSSSAKTTETGKKNLEKNATCSENKECRSGSCNPGTSKCIQKTS